jgi:hypothetical protein
MWNIFFTSLLQHACLTLLDWWEGRTLGVNSQVGGGLGDVWGSKGKYEHGLVSRRAFRGTNHLAERSHLR